MQELIELLELNTTNEPLPYLIDVIKEVYIQKEKEQITKAWDERANPYPYENDENWQVLDCTGEFYYNHTYTQNK